MAFKSIFDDSNITARCKSQEKRRKAMIIHPGALGDCILTLHLCNFIKSHMQIDVLDYIGNIDHIALFPGKTIVDKVRSINSIDLSRLFVDSNEFNPENEPKLVANLAGYDWIFSFMGNKGDNFEQNLISTLYQTTSGDVVTLDTKPPSGYAHHISKFHIDDLVNEKYAAIEAFTPPENWTFNFEEPTINLSDSQKSNGSKLLRKYLPNTDLPTIMIAPGSGSIDKNWHLDNYKQLALELIKNKNNILFILGPSELERMTTVEINALEEIAPTASSLDTIKLTELISNAQAFIGNDSGVTHLSAATGVSTVVIFGKTNPAIYSPVGPDVKIVNQKSNAFERYCKNGVDELVDITTNILLEKKG